MCRWNQKDPVPTWLSDTFWVRIGRALCHPSIPRLFLVGQRRKTQNATLASDLDYLETLRLAFSFSRGRRTQTPTRGTQPQQRETFSNDVISTSSRRRFNRPLFCVPHRDPLTRLKLQAICPFARERDALKRLSTVKSAANGESMTITVRILKATPPPIATDRFERRTHAGQRGGEI